MKPGSAHRGKGLTAPRRLWAGAATIWAVALLSGCPQNQQGAPQKAPEGAAACEKTGQQCTLAPGKLGVCLKAGAGDTTGRWRCEPQH